MKLILELCAHILNDSNISYADKKMVLKFAVTLIASVTNYAESTGHSIESSMQ